MNPSSALQLLLSIFLLSLVAMGHQKVEEGKPLNVLFIVADDMNEYGFFHTHPQLQTPYLDAFRERSISFRQAYCPAPACSPSRTSFLSGVSPHRSGKYYNGSAVWETPLMQAQESMMEWFQRAGYNTYGKGKLFHSQIPKERVAKNFQGSRGKGGFGPFPDEAHRNFGSKGKFRGVQAFPDETFPDVQNAQHIAQLLQEAHDEPFFIMYGLWRPHSPYTCPQRFLDLYDPAEIVLPRGYLKNDLEDLPAMPRAYLAADDQPEFDRIAQNETQWRAYLRGYLACYSFADYNIGQVLAALDESPYRDNTIVVITSDNGFHMGEKDRFNKNALWEQSAITPMAIRIPGTKHAGKVCNQPVNLLDLYPTFVDYCGEGLPPLQPIDGQSIRPLLDNPDRKRKTPSITYFGKDWVSIRSERYRYISYPDGSEELYDHSRDPWEWHNLADEPASKKVKKRHRKFIPKEMVNAVEGRWTTKIKEIVDRDSQ